MMIKRMLILGFVLISCSLYAQRGIVKGSLLNDNGLALPGAIVHIKGTRQATVSDMNGDYSIECQAGDVLEISFIGMCSKEKKVNEEMFDKLTGESGYRQKPIVQIPVNMITGKAYTDLINNSINHEGKYRDMNAAPYSWKYHDDMNSSFYACNFKEIPEQDIVYELVTNLLKK